MSEEFKIVGLTDGQLSALEPDFSDLFIQSSEVTNPYEESRSQGDFPRRGLETLCGGEEARTVTGTRAGGRFSQKKNLALEPLSFPKPRSGAEPSSLIKE